MDLLTRFKSKRGTLQRENFVAVAEEQAPEQQEEPAQGERARAECLAEEEKCEVTQEVKPGEEKKAEAWAEAPLSEVAEVSREAERVANMSLASFANKKIVAKVQSSVLGKTVIFASDNAFLKEEDKEVGVYRASELRLIAVMEPDAETLKAIDRVKSIFNGRVIDWHKITKEADKNERDKTIDDRGNSQGVQAV
jgi:hypothetical protein